MFRPLIALSMGDPTGIGPEVCLKALLSPSLYRISRPFIVGKKRYLEEEKRKLGISTPLRRIENLKEGKFTPSFLEFMEPEGPSPPIPKGKIDPRGAKVALDCVEKAVNLALKREIQALVTAPLNKEALRRLGVPAQGHTELLRTLSKVKEVEMMLVGEKTFRVVLLTRHLPLREIFPQITQERIISCLRLTSWGLKKWFSLSSPLIGVAGMNPHRGEGGTLGREEKEIIEPAIEEVTKEGIRVEGPFSPDTVFLLLREKKLDAVVSLYHDQGLIPFKLLYFQRGVNLTLGLPFVRTSPVHGTALDIAGKGKAEETSMREAIKLAGWLSRKSEERNRKSS